MARRPDSDASNRSAHRPRPPVRPNDGTDLVLTPGGLRPRSLVHQLRPGEHVSAKGGHIRIIETATGKVVKDLGETGKQAPKADAQPAPKHQAGSVPGLSDVGWIENSQWRNGDANPIVYFSTTWIVPPEPASSDSQTVYLFNGLQPDSAAHILQPVLQWGPSAAGGGNNWSITNWYADGQGGAAVFQPLINVNVGDVLQGVMTCTGQSGTEFSYVSSFVGYPAADTTVTDVEELTWAFETLECYGPFNSTTNAFDPLSQCSDYPNTLMTAMYDIEIKTGTPGTSGTDTTIDWVPETNFTDCGQNCLIISNDSPGGSVYLYYKTPVQNFYFVVDKGTFGKDEVKDVIAHGGVFPAAFYLALEGFTVQQLTIDRPSLAAPSISGAFSTLSGVTVAPSTMYPPVYDATNLYSPQRILFPFDITFTSAALGHFPGSGVTAEELDATIDFGSAALGTNQHLTARTEMFLGAGAAPYFTNVDPHQNNAFYLSQDLRVFTITPEANGATPIDNVPFNFVGGSPTVQDVDAAFAYIRALIGHFNSTYSNPGGVDPFDVTHSVLPNQGAAYSGDTTVSPTTPNPVFFFPPYRNYNFALARVRLTGSTSTAGQAENVRVFFRLFTTQTFDTDYINTASAVSAGDPNITYPSAPPASPNAPTSPLPGTDAGGTINGSTLPFFAAADQSDLAAGGVNNQTIVIPGPPGGTGSVWAYFGCFLNVYDSSLNIGGHDPQFWLAGSSHNCIVAQIAYVDTPIENVNGVIENPDNSNLLAQRNLQITYSGNPGFPATHLIPQTFDTRPSPPPASGYLTDYPDELMIDWRNTPVGSSAQIYWPEVNAADVLALAAKLYPSSGLTAIDAHTIGCTVGSGMTYVPIPPGGSESFAGLITLQLPNGIRVGGEYNVVVRRITSRRFQTPVLREHAAAASVGKALNWRYVVGTFQMKIPVARDAKILPTEENLLAILKWRLTLLQPSDRWYPVLVRYIEYVSGRVRGFGGDPTQIEPSPNGTGGAHGKPPHHPPHPEHHEWTGKVSAVRYNRFGDFIGFDLLTLSGEERCFHGREREIEDLVRTAWTERILLTVVGSKHDAEWPAEIILRRPPSI